MCLPVIGFWCESVIAQLCTSWHVSVTFVSLESRVLVYCCTADSLIEFECGEVVSTSRLEPKLLQSLWASIQSGSVHESSASQRYAANVHQGADYLGIKEREG